MFVCDEMPRCKHVFVDVGANIGMHARFLFEPKRYPRSPYSRLFERVLGDERNETCAVEIEPNPNHRKRHLFLKDHYTKKGMTYIYLPNAVDRAPFQNLSFYLNPTIRGGDTHSDWSFGIKNRQKNNVRFEVQSIGLDDVLNCFDARKTGRMIVKMDIEGMEYDVVSSLLLHGALCRLDFLSVEWHPKFVSLPSAHSTDRVVNTKSEARRFTAVVQDVVTKNRDTCKLKAISNLDDETYTNDL